MAIRLSCGSDSFPLVQHELMSSIVAGLGFDGFDLMVAGNRAGTANATNLRLEEILADPAGWAGRLDERLRSRGLEISDFFASPWTDLETMAPNHPDPAELRRGHEMFERVLECALHLGVSGITMPCGIDWPGESHADSLARAAEEHGRRAEKTRAHGLGYSTEPHVGSVAQTPADTLELCRAAPGLQLTLDYSHYLALGHDEEECETLLPYARHVHVRGAAKGRIQVPMRESTIDVERMVDRLVELGYDGFVTAEYVWVPWGGLDEIDVLSEVILMRDRLRAKLATVTT
jgi:sugar phosphate isomerase/epimerase